MKIKAAMIHDGGRQATDGPVVRVRRRWNDSRRVAIYRLDDILGLHWSNLSGGLRHGAPRLFLHGYVMCDRILEGTLSHSCRHGPPPHRIKVCVIKKGNEAVFPELVKRSARGSNAEEYLAKVRARLPPAIAHDFNREIRAMFPAGLYIDETVEHIISRQQRKGKSGG